MKCPKGGYVHVGSYHSHPTEDRPFSPADEEYASEDGENVPLGKGVPLYDGTIDSSVIYPDGKIEVLP